MKRIKNSIIGIFLVLTLFFIASVGLAQTQSPPPPPGHGTQTDGGGGSAPVGEGLVFMIALGAAYGARKVYSMRRKLAE